MAWITVADLAGSERHEITPRPAKGRTWGDYNPVWSPDGSRLAFVRAERGNGSLYGADCEALACAACFASGRSREAIGPTIRRGRRWAAARLRERPALRRERRRHDSRSSSPHRRVIPSGRRMGGASSTSSMLRHARRGEETLRPLAIGRSIGSTPTGQIAADSPSPSWKVPRAQLWRIRGCCLVARPTPDRLHRRLLGTARARLVLLGLPDEGRRERQAPPRQGHRLLHLGRMGRRRQEVLWPRGPAYATNLATGRAHSLLPDPSPDGAIWSACPRTDTRLPLLNWQRRQARRANVSGQLLQRARTPTGWDYRTPASTFAERG